MIVKDVRITLLRAPYVEQPALHLYPDLMIQLMASEDMGLLEDIWADPVKPVRGVITAPEHLGYGLRIKPDFVKEYTVA